MALKVLKVYEKKFERICFKVTFLLDNTAVKL